MDIRLFSEKSLHKECHDNGFEILTADKAAKSDYEVIIVTDPFTVSYEAHGLIAMASFMRSIGYKVAFLRAYVNGKIKVIRGQRRSFVHFAAKQAARLDLIAKSGKALVGYDPALTICYRDEYTQMLGDRRGEFDVKLPEEWLNEQFGTKTFVERFAKIKDKVEQAARTSEFKDPYFLFTPCPECALALLSQLLWSNLMQHSAVNVIPAKVR